MNRATTQTIIGASLALAVGMVLARVVPGASLANTKANTSTSNNGTAATNRPESALARIVRTETGSKRWLVVLAQVEKADAAKMPALIRSAEGNDAMIRMIAARWAELDPDHMFASLYADMIQPSGAPGTLPSLWILTDVLFEEWAKKDPDAVIKALNEVPNFSNRDNLRMQVASRILQADVEKGLLAMNEWNIRHYIPDMKKVAEWAGRDPRHAAEIVSKLGGEYMAREAMKYVGRAWAQSDPQGGLRHAETLNFNLRTALASEIVGTWAQRDLSAAVKFVTEEDSVSRNTVAQGLVNTWAKSDPAAALKWSQDNLQGAAKTETIGELMKTVAEKDIEAAGELAAGMETGAAQNRACASIFETWFNKGKDQRDAALAWLAELPDQRAKDAAFEKVQWNWMWNDPNGVRDFISGPHGHMAPDMLINQVARNQSSKNPEAALEWAARLPEKQANAARQAVFENWMQIRPDGAAAYALKLPAGADRDYAIRSISRNFTFESSPLEPSIEWFRKLPAADQKTALDAVAEIATTPERKRKLEEALGKK